MPVVPPRGRSWGKDLRVNRSRSAFALGLVVPTLLLGGCSEDPVPKVAPKESASASASQSESASASPTALDPVATVRAWVAAQNDAHAAGEHRWVRWRCSTDATVEACEGLVDPIEKVHQSGGTSVPRAGRSTAPRSERDSAIAKVDTAVTIRAGERHAANAAGEVAGALRHRQADHGLQAARRIETDGWFRSLGSCHDGKAILFALALGCPWPRCPDRAAHAACGWVRVEHMIERLDSHRVADAL